MEKCIIAAVASDGAIGKGNDLLWHISQDLRNFKVVTGQSPIIMGRKTFESLGSRPLPGRRNIVISPSLAEKTDRINVPELERYPDFADVVSTLADAYALAEQTLTSENLGPSVEQTYKGDNASVPTEQAIISDGAYALAENNSAVQRCFVIGGAMVYADAIAGVDRLFITHIDATVPSADRFFPEISPLIWTKVSESETFTDPKSGVKFRFAEYIKTVADSPKTL